MQILVLVGFYLVFMNIPKLELVLWQEITFAVIWAATFVPALGATSIYKLYVEPKVVEIDETITENPDGTFSVMSKTYRSRDSAIAYIDLVKRTRAADPRFSSDSPT